MPAKEALETRFHKHYISEPNSGCWIWIGAVIKSKGALYGVIKRDRADIKVRGGSNDLAHRVAFGLYKEAVTPEKQIDHTCRNTLCVNPNHLELVTGGENTRRAYIRLYGNACKKGHPFDEANTWTEKNGQRHCRKCHAEREALRRKGTI